MNYITNDKELKKLLIDFGQKIVEAVCDNPDWSIEELAEKHLKSIKLKRKRC